MDVGQTNLSINYIIKHYESLHPKKLKNPISNLGFTNSNLWAKTELKNHTALELKYYLEPAGPIYLAELFTYNKTANKITKAISGYTIPYLKRSLKNRKTLFRINIPPHSTVDLFYT